MQAVQYRPRQAYGPSPSRGRAERRGDSRRLHQCVAAGAGPAGAADDVAAQRGEPGARAAGRGAPRVLSQGRPGAAAAGLRGRRGAARRPVAPLRRPVHHPPAGGRQHPGRTRHGHHHAGRRAAARHRRGHRLHAGGADRRLRRRGRPPGRRRHQAGQGGARQRRRGRDHPQDDHRDGPGPAGAGDQGRRPAAQHAHHAVPAAGEAGPQGPRDPGSHCAAGPSAGHGDRQVGAGGSVVRDPAPQEVRGDRPAGRRPGAVARHLPGQGARRDQCHAERSRRSPPSWRAGPSTTGRSTRR